MRVDACTLVDQLAHRHAESLSAAGAWIGLQLLKRPRRELHGGIGIHSPLGDKQRPRSRVEEGCSQAGQRLGSLTSRTRRVASGQNYPVGVELKCGDLGGCKIAVVALEQYRVRRVAGWRR